MGRYTLIVEKTAKIQLSNIFKSGNKSDIKKIEQIFAELAEHPTTGTGNPEQLKYQLSGFWSRRINRKDRLIYKVNESKVEVIILSAQGHYE